MFDGKRERELRRQAEIRRNQIANKAACRRGMRTIAMNEKMMRSVILENRAKALDAENRGDHARAVSCAKLAHQLETQLTASSDMRNTVEAAYAMNENAATFKQIMDSTGSLMNGVSGMVDMGSLYAAQLDVEMAREQMDINSEYCEDFLNETFSDHEKREDPVGEEELNRIMNDSLHDRRLKILESTNDRLDRLCRTGTAGKP